MSFVPNYKEYTLKELYTAKHNVSKEKYPDKIADIELAIFNKENGILEETEIKEIYKVAGEKSTRWHRFWAASIDMIINLGVSTLPLLYFGMEAFKEPSISLVIIMLVYSLLMTLIVQGYLLFNYGQTIGKRIIGTRIENLDGTKAEFKKILLLRILPMSLCSAIPTAGQIIAGFINPIFIFGKERRCLHDYIAKTKVCYVRT